MKQILNSKMRDCVKHQMSCFLLICFAIMQMVGTTFAAEGIGDQPVVLETLRSGLHEQHTSVVLEFNKSFDFNRPQRMDDEIRFTLNNVYTELGPYREYPLSASWVRLKPIEEDIEVGVGPAERGDVDDVGAARTGIDI